MLDILPFLNNVIKLLMALFCGALVGIRREKKGDFSALYIHVLLAVASCLLMIAATYPPFGSPEVSVTVITIGSGLIGASVIIGERGSPPALAAAAALWATAAIGVSIAAELFVEAAVITLLTYLILGRFARLREPE